MIVGLGATTLLCRSFFLLFGTRLTIPEEFQRALRYAPLGALIAILIPEFVLVPTPGGGYAWTLFNPKLWGGIVAILCFVFSRSMMLTIAMGMGVFLLVAKVLR
jgi:branched-subunit amino acid transport protein